MFCKNCGNAMDPNAAICVKCGCATGTGANFCPNCGQPTAPGAFACTNCGFGLATAAAAPAVGAKSKLTAGLLGIFLGGFGVHNFYLGYTGKAVAQLLIALLGSCIAVGPAVAGTKSNLLQSVARQVSSARIWLCWTMRHLARCLNC